MLENPLIRKLHQTVTSPDVLRAIAKLAQTDMSDEEIDEIVNKGPRQREAAKKMGDRKKQAKKSAKENPS